MQRSRRARKLVNLGREMYRDSSAEDVSHVIEKNVQVMVHSKPPIHQKGNFSGTSVTQAFNPSILSGVDDIVTISSQDILPEKLKTEFEDFITVVIEPEEVEPNETEHNSDPLFMEENNNLLNEKLMDEMLGTDYSTILFEGDIGNNEVLDKVPMDCSAIEKSTGNDEVLDETPTDCSMISLDIENNKDNKENAGERRDSQNKNSEDGEDFSAGSDDEWRPDTSIIRQQQTNSDTESDAVIEDVPQLENASRKRKKKGQGPYQRTLRNERKEKRKKGEEYVTAKGKQVPARSFVSLPEICKLKCKQKLTNVNLDNLHSDYRKLPNREAQKRYLAGLITVKPKERNRGKVFRKNREIAVNYTIDGADGYLCKNCFMKIFRETRGFLDDIIKKKKTSPTAIILVTDNRGLTPSGNKRPEADTQFIKDFINRFPAYESHYSRRHTQKRYLGYDLNMTILYKLYKEEHEKSHSTDDSLPPVSLTVFRDVFKTMNLKFKKPANDTCKTCDAFVLKLKSCVSEDARKQIEEERKEHQEKADFHYESKKKDKILSKASSGKVVVGSFDLQKCLATPQLKTSLAFYKRKLWTFNETVRNVTTKVTSCYMWHEGIAQRGADEVASALHRFIMNLPDEVEVLILYSDTCPGQNRNNILGVMFILALHKKTSLKEIHHKFLVPGHTHLECDSDHALIERFVHNHNPTISVPQDWYNVVQMTSSRFDVTTLSQNEIFGLSKLLTTCFAKKNIDTDKKTFTWNQIYWLMYERNSTDVKFKYTLKEEEPFRAFSILKRGRAINLDVVSAPLAYSKPLPIDKKKYKDIMDLLQYIDPIYHKFYLDLNQTTTASPEVCSDSDEEYD